MTGRDIEFDEQMREKRDEYLDAAVQPNREREKKRLLESQAETLRNGMDKDTRNMIREIKWQALDLLQKRLNDGNVSTRLLVELACHLPK